MLTAMVWNNCKCFRAYIEGVTRLKNYRTSDPDTAAGLSNSMPTLCIIGPAEETGGARHIIHTADWSGFIPMCKIARKSISPN